MSDQSGRTPSPDCTCWTAPITDTDEAVAACPVHRKAGRVSSSARARYEDVSSRGEAALTSGDPAKRQAWLDAMTQAEMELHAARNGPSWESLLADPTSQPFGADEVAASVRAYEDAPLASACACGGSMHKRCKP